MIDVVGGPNNLGMLVIQQGNPPHARTILEHTTASCRETGNVRSLALAETTPNPLIAAAVMEDLGIADLLAGDLGGGATPLD